MFNKIVVETHEPIHLKDANLDAVLSEMETTIKKHINQ